MSVCTCVMNVNKCGCVRLCACFRVCVYACTQTTLTRTQAHEHNFIHMNGRVFLGVFMFICIYTIIRTCVRVCECIYVHLYEWKVYI